MNTNYTRYGSEISLISSIIEWHPPMTFVDGEYWFGRQLFSLTGGLIKGDFNNVSWHLFRMIAFDSPAQVHHSAPFENRYAHQLLNAKDDHPFIIIPIRVQWQGSEHLDQLVQGCMQDCGEGVILRRSGSPYQSGRSTDLVKIKAGQVDQEGIVVKIESGKYVQLKLHNGRILDVGWEQVQIKTLNENEHEEVKLKVGDVVTFTSESYARHALPVNAIITRIRIDTPWTTPESSPDESPSPRNTALPMQYWTPHNMRAFFEKLARDKNLNPLFPATWYSIKESDIRQSKSGNTILKKFSGYAQAVTQLFPELSFDINSFPKAISLHNIEHRRNYFEKLARSLGFDPLVPDNWYNQPIENITAAKGLQWVLSYHKSSLPTALSDLFPDIGFDKSQWTAPWYGPRNRRKFFEEYAQAHGFDPLLPSNWYSEQKDQIMSVKGAARVLSYHGDSVSRALADLFPEIGIDRKKFELKALWKEEKERRAFFERYAHDRNFDPLVAHNWYSQSISDILSVKGAKRVVAYHGHSVGTALVELFPDVALQRHLLWQRTLWTNEDSRREFFKDYATSHGFDWRDATSWYSQPRDHIMAVKGAKAVVAHHSYSVKKALMQLFPSLGLVPRNFWQKRT